MAYDAGLFERMRDILPRLAGGTQGIRDKNIFSGRGFMLGKSAFLIVWGHGIIVKMAPDAYDAALAMRGVTPFAPGGERPMGTWVVVAADEVADDPELLEWAERGIIGVRAAPAPKKRRSQPKKAKASAKRAKDRKATPASGARRASKDRRSTTGRTTTKRGARRR
jgi:hypothetical protein